MEISANRGHCNLAIYRTNPDTDYNKGLMPIIRKSVKTNLVFSSYACSAEWV
jgi:hypothetical protein